MPRRTCRSAVTLAGILAAASLASGDSGASVNLPLRGRDKVAGTLRPANDQECFLCDIPRGAALAVSLKGKSAGGPVFQLALLDGGTPVPGTSFVTKGPGVSLTQPFALAASGHYRVRVTGDGDNDGDYELKVAWKVRTSWSETGGPIDPAAQASFTFAAPAGGGATIDVKPAARSAFAAQILSVTGPDGPLVVPMGTSSHLVLSGLPSTGDYTVEFRNAAAAAGNWTARAKVKPPRTTAGSIDIRDSHLTGAFGPDHTVYGSVIGPTGGSLEISATFGPLDGTSVTVPMGALAGPTILTVSAAPPLALGAANHHAGPAVQFGPPGTTFDPSGTDPSKQATITIPFDPAFFPSGTDSLVVFVRSSSGALSAVPRPYVFGANIVSFTTSHFSSYQAASPGPRALSGDFLVLDFGGDEKAGFGGQYGFGLSRLVTSANGTAVFEDKQRVNWDDKGATGAFATLQQKFNNFPVNVQVSDDQTVVVVDPADPTSPTKLRRGASDDVLVGVKEPIVLLRRAGAPPTMSTVAGQWHVFHLGLGTRLTTGQLPGFSFELGGDAGVMNLLPDGTVTFASVSGVQANSVFPVGTWQSKADKTAPQGLTWSILDTNVRLGIPDLTYPILFTAALDGAVLVGRGTTPGGNKPDEGPAADLFVLVRVSSGAKLSAAVGDYFHVGGESDTVDAKSPAPGQGMNFIVTTATATIVKSGDLSATGIQDVYSHDGQGAPSEQHDLPISATLGRLSVKPDGSFTSTDGASGAFSRGGELFVKTIFDGKRFALDFGTPLGPPVTITKDK